MLARSLEMLSSWLTFRRPASSPDVASSSAVACSADGSAQGKARPDALRSPWRECVFGLFAGAPNDVLAQIVRHIDGGDFAAWGMTCRNARAVLRPHQLWCMLPRALDGVVSLQTLRIAVDEIERWQLPRAHHWIAALTTRLRWMEEGLLLAAMRVLLDATQRLPPCRRGEPLCALADALGVPAAESVDPLRCEFEQQLYRAIRSLAGTDDASGMRALAALMRHGSSILNRSGKAQTWTAEIRTLPETWRSSALAALLARTNRDGGNPAPATWWRRLALALSMPAENRDLALVALTIPNERMTQEMAVQRFDAMLPIAAALPEHQRPGLYAALACLCMVLPPERMAAQWSRLMDLNEALPEPQRAQAIAPLYGAVGCMHGPGQHQCLARIEAYLHSAMPAVWTEPCDDAPASGSERLADLRIHVRGTDFWVCLPREQSGALARFLPAVEDRLVAPQRDAQMPPRLRARALQSRAARLQNMQGLASVHGYSFELRTWGWDSLLDSVNTLPEKYRREPLLALIQVANRAWPLTDPVFADVCPLELIPIVSDSFDALVTTNPHRAWWRAKHAAALDDWIALTIEWQRAVVPEDMWELAYHLLLSRARGWRKTELLIWLCRAPLLPRCPERWSRLFEAARSLPPLQRLRVMHSLALAVPDNEKDGSPSPYRQRLAEEITAMRGRERE